MRTLTKIVLLMPLAAWPLTGQSGTELTVKQLNKRLEQLKARQAADARRLRLLEKQLEQLMARQGSDRQVVQNRDPARAQPPARLTAEPATAAVPPLLPVAGTPARRALAQTTTPAVAQNDGPPGAAPTATPESAAHAQSASVRAVTQADQPFAENAGRWTVDTGLTYAHYDRKQLALNGFLALGAIFLGEIKVDNVKADTWTFDTTARYTFSDRLQMDLNVPFLYRSSVYQSTGADQDGTKPSEQNVAMYWSAGDVSSGLYYKWLRETGSLPEVVLNGRIKAPTGSSPYGIKMVTAPDNSSLQTPARLASGNGLWSVSSGVSVSKTLDPAVIFASLNYFHNQKAHFNDINSTGDAQPGEVDMGDAWQFGVGTAFALNERMSLSLSYLQRLQRQSRLRADGGNWASVVGSDANAGVLNLGGAYALGKRQSVVFNLGAGLTPDAPNVQMGLRFVQSF